jgi:hypothetical protein
MRTLILAASLVLVAGVSGCKAVQTETCPPDLVDQGGYREADQPRGPLAEAIMKQSLPELVLNTFVVVPAELALMLLYAWGQAGTGARLH